MTYLSIGCIAAWKIHVSPQTKEILDVFGTFVLQHRGLVAMKVCFPHHLLTHLVTYLLPHAVNCVRFCFGVVCDFCLCMRYLWNIWTDLRQIHTEDVFGPSLGRVWRSKSISTACVRFMFGKHLCSSLLPYSFWKSLRMDKTTEFKGGNFYETQCRKWLSSTEYAISKDKFQRFLA